MFREGEEAEALENEKVHLTVLTQYFAANEQAQNREDRGELLEFDCRQLLYQEFPSRMTWNAKNREWRIRKARFSTIGHMVYVSPAAGERFYLRLLLTAVRRATSFEHLRTVNGHLHPTFQSACVALGLLTTDKEWDQCLREAATWQVGGQLRRLFVLILLNCRPNDPLLLWNNHTENLSHDCLYKLENEYGIQQPTSDQVASLALSLIRAILNESNSNLKAHGLSEPQHEFQPVLPLAVRLIQEQRVYNVDALRQIVAQDTSKLNDDQRIAHDAICQAVERRRGELFFLDGFGGTGKTFVINLTLARVRSEGKIALAVALSGIAATLLDGGTTAHSWFKIPIQINERSTCEIKAQDALADLMRGTHLPKRN